MADTASGARSMVWDSRFVCGIEKFEDTEDSSSDSDSDSEIKLVLEAVAGYKLYTSSRDSLGSGKSKSFSRRDWRYFDDLYALLCIITRQKQ